MWLTQIWVLSVLVCSDPGTEQVHCTPHVFGPYVSEQYCRLNADFLSEALRDHKPRETPISVEVSCFAGKPDREA